MRYIGNKENVVDTIFSIMEEKGIKGNSFFDFFSGTTNVSKFFKNKGYKIISCDIMYYSFVMQMAYVKNNNINPLFDRLLSKYNIEKKCFFETNLQKVLNILDNLELEEGFIYNNYTPEGTSNLKIPRQYFSDYNGKKIDTIRIKIEEWKNENLISENEYYILLTCLIETVPFYANISGVYAAFHKKWDVRALKELKLREVQLLDNSALNEVYCTNSVELLNDVEADIFYLDPPYNQRQYAPNYHILETIAKYDNPQIKGVTGLRDYQNQKSKFCNKNTAIKELEEIIAKGRFKFMILSYNSEGIMNKEDILSLMNKFGRTELVEFDYLRYKSNNNGESKNKKFIKEQLYILEKTI